MPVCVKCGFFFTGLGYETGPFLNEHTGQWICVGCYLKLVECEKAKYTRI